MTPKTQSVCRRCNLHSLHMIHDLSNREHSIWAKDKHKFEPLPEPASTGEREMIYHLGQYVPCGAARPSAPSAPQPSAELQNKCDFCRDGDKPTEDGFHTGIVSDYKCRNAGAAQGGEIAKQIAMECYEHMHITPTQEIGIMKHAETALRPYFPPASQTPEPTAFVELGKLFDRLKEDMGWRGHGPNKDIFYCEYCHQSHEDCTKISHLEYCHVMQLRSVINWLATPASTARKDVPHFSDCDYNCSCGWKSDPDSHLGAVRD